MDAPVCSDTPRSRYGRICLATPKEQLFAAAVNDGVIGNSLTTFLHDRHPRTAHPPRPRPVA
jgi:hypothetical protein